MTDALLRSRAVRAGACVGAALALSLAGTPRVPAVGRLPDDPRTHAEQAYYRGEIAQAELSYRVHLAEHPGDRQTVLDLSAVLMDAGRPTEAARLLERYGVSGFELGEAYLASGDRTGARRELTAALRRPGPQWRTRVLLGLIAGQEGRHAEAVEYFWQTLNEEYRQPTVHQLMARSLAALGETSPQARDYFRERAREEYERALKIDPSLWQVHGDLALLAESEGDLRTAAREWNEVRAILGRRTFIDEAQRRIAAQQAGTVPTASPTPTALPAVEAEIPAVPAARFRDLRVMPLSGPEDPELRVGLADGLSSLSFGCSGAWTAVDARGRVQARGEAGRTYQLSRTRGEWVLGSSGKAVSKRWASRQPLFLSPVDPTQVMGVVGLYQGSGYFWGGGARATRYYRGRLEVAPKGRKVQLVNRVRLEDYLASVVPAEMPASWPAEALKAQAVAARGDAWSRRGTHGRQGFEICNTPHCAEYGGVTVEDPRTLEAVRATTGQVLRRDGRLVHTFYSHACGGLTQSYEDAWGGGRPGDVPGILDQDGTTAVAERLPLSPSEVRTFLTTRPPVFCADPRYSGRASFRWVKLITRDELSAVLGDRSEVGRVRSLRVTERSRSAYVRALHVDGDAGETIVRGDRIRTWMGGLRSNLFMLVPVPGPNGGEPEAWLAWGGGWGHGVGFCQAGAAAMGSNGYTYLDILEHYFPDARLEALRRLTPEGTQTADQGGPPLPLTRPKRGRTPS